MNGLKVSGASFCWLKSHSNEKTLLYWRCYKTNIFVSSKVFWMQFNIRDHLEKFKNLTLNLTWDKNTNLIHTWTKVRPKSLLSGSWSGSLNSVDFLTSHTNSPFIRILVHHIVSFLQSLRIIEVSTKLWLFSRQKLKFCCGFSLVSNITVIEESKN